MNIKDLPQGSYKVIQPAKLNVKDLPAGSYKTLSSNNFPTQEPEEVKRNFLQQIGRFATGFGKGASNLAIGAAKGAVSTVKGAADLGQDIYNPLTNAVGNKISKTLGDKTLVQRAKASDIIPKAAYTPKNTTENVGFGIEQVGEFFTPVGLETKGAGLIARAGAGALEFGGKTAIQTGGDAKQTIQNTIIGGGFPLIGKAVELAAKPLKKVLSEKIAPAMLDKYILKPVAKDFHFGIDPGAGVAKEGLKANTREGLLTQITGKKKEIGNAIDSLLKNGEGSKKVINIRPALNQIDDEIAKTAQSGEEALYKRLTSIRDGITSKFKIVEGKAIKIGDNKLDISPYEAAVLKRKIGNASKWTGQAFDAEANQARVKIYRTLNTLIDEAVPGSKTLNARYANLLTAEKSLDHTINVVKRQNPIGLINAGAGAAYGTYSALSGDSTPEALAKGLLFSLSIKGATSTAVQSRVAARLAKLAPEQKTAIAKAMPYLRNIILGVRSSRKKNEQNDGQESDKNKPQ